MVDIYVIHMGEVICVYRIMPGGPDDFDRVKKALEDMKPNRLEEDPVAFGLIALKFTKIIPDDSGSLEDLENRLNSIEGVGSVENTMTSRAM